MTRLMLNLQRFLLVVVCSLPLVIMTGCGGGTSDISSVSGDTPAPINPGTGDNTPIGVGVSSVTVSWDPPTTKVDGSTLDNLSGYVILYGTTQGVYTQEINVNNPGIATYVIDGLSNGTYYFVVRAVNSSGLMSPYSNEAVKIIGS
jgi:hypothetical protein